MDVFIAKTRTVTGRYGGINQGFGAAHIHMRALRLGLHQGFDVQIAAFAVHIAVAIGLVTTGL